MKHRAGFLLAALLLSSTAWGQQYRAFWADAFHDGYKTPEQVDKLVGDLETAKANAVFVQARRRADTYFRQSLEPFAEDARVPPGFDPLEYLVQKAHAKGIEVHAWVVVYPMWRAGDAPPSDPRHLYHSHGPAASGEDRWLGMSSTGTETLGLDPGHPGVLPYLIDVFLEPVKRYDVDGLHLDYVRYPEDADYGYNPWALERFRRQANRVGFPSRTDPVWSQWRRDQVTALVRQLYLRMQLVNPGAKLSAATITWGNGPLSDDVFRTLDAYSRVFQDWRGWLEEGILDLSIPMNYFREAQYPGFLDRWSEYEKNRQYGRGYVNGLGGYLNTLPQTIAQMERVLRPSAVGNMPLGICFYSYAVPRSEGESEPQRSEFYRMVGDYFQEPASAPELAWKTRPEKGHLMGTVGIDGGPAWWKDGIDIQVEDSAGVKVRDLKTDVSGFFGAVDLSPGEYRLRAERDGRVLRVSGMARVDAGRVAELRLLIGVEEMKVALPAIEAPEGFKAAPGDMVRLNGRNLAKAHGYAEAVPFPREIGGTMIVVNGLAAPLLEIGEEFVVFQVPYAEADTWDIRARRAGGESAPVAAQVVAANPVIREVRRSGGDELIIYATGLGMTDPPAISGAGGSAEEPFHRTVLPVRVLVNAGAGEVEVEPGYAGLQPWVPGHYLVRAKLPARVSEGEVRLKTGDAISEAVRF